MLRHFYFLLQEWKAKTGVVMTTCTQDRSSTSVTDFTNAIVTRWSETFTAMLVESLFRRVKVIIKAAKVVWTNSTNNGFEMDICMLYLMEQIHELYTWKRLVNTTHNAVFCRKSNRTWSPLKSSYPLNTSETNTVSVNIWSPISQQWHTFPYSITD